MNSTLTFGTTTETGGTWGVTVTGTSGGRAHNVTATFILASGPDFSMTANPNNITINCCSAADSTITLASLSGFSGTVSLAAAVSPAGPAVSLNYPNVTLSAGGTGSSILSVRIQWSRDSNILSPCRNHCGPDSDELLRFRYRGADSHGKCDRDFPHPSYWY